MVNNTSTRLHNEAMTEMQCFVTQQRDTEPSYSGKLLKNK